jgi:hypothetical protein
MQKLAKCKVCDPSVNGRDFETDCNVRYCHLLILFLTVTSDPKSCITLSLR